MQSHSKSNLLRLPSSSLRPSPNPALRLPACLPGIRNNVTFSPTKTFARVSEAPLDVDCQSPPFSLAARILPPIDPASTSPSPGLMPPFRPLNTPMPIDTPNSSSINLGITRAYPAGRRALLLQRLPAAEASGHARGRPGHRQVQALCLNLDAVNGAQACEPRGYSITGQLPAAGRRARPAMHIQRPLHTQAARKPP